VVKEGSEEGGRWAISPHRSRQGESDDEWQVVGGVGNGLQDDTVSARKWRYW